MRKSKRMPRPINRFLLEGLEDRRLLSVGSPMEDEALPTYRLAPHNDGIMPAGSAGPSGISPAGMRHAYGVDAINFGGVSGDGTGQTIAIIDAYHAPNALADLNSFSSTFSLPLFNQTGGPTFTQLNQDGGSALPGTDPAPKPITWALEAMLDIEWAHVIAPKANIILYEAKSASYNDLVVHAVNAARNNPSVSVVSMSFGGGEFSNETILDPYFTTPSGHAGVTFLASTGDTGSPGGYPAYSPNVIAVGGTSLSIDSFGNYLGEYGWSGSGGGTSAVEAEPNYQLSVQSSSRRQIPDVAMDADPSSGVPVYDSFDNGAAAPWITVGGTSLSAPMWAGLIAIANQGRALNGLSSLNGAQQTLPMLYQAPASDFHDITGGSNGSFSAGLGYDQVTGRGTAIANLLVPVLVGVTNQPPVIQGLTASPNPVIAGNNVTLTGSGVGDPDGTVASVSFYRETNGTSGLQTGSGGDTLLGTDSNGTDGWTIASSTAGLAGSFAYYAQARDNGGSLSNAASTTVAVTTPSTSTLTFVNTDTTTQGTWTGVYGSDGYSILDGPSALPSYAQVSVSNQLNYVWAPSTTDVRALQTAAGSSSRMASCYYSSASFTLDVNLTDGQTHQMALYMLDWDSTSRAQTVRVTDASTGATLDSRSVSNFHNGQYLVWNVSGHVQITFLYGGGANAVASGLFFGSSATQAPTAPTSLTATAPAPTRVVLNWTASTGPVSSYHVERSSNGSPFTEIAANVSGTTYTDNTVQQNTSYTYQVRAQNSAGFSGYSNPQPVTTPGTPAPAMPANLTATPSSAGILLQWSPNTEADLAGYNVLRSSSPGGPFTQLNTTLLSTTSYNDTSASPGAASYYQVVAVNTSGQSSSPASASATRPAAGSTLTFVNTDTTTQGTWTGVYGSDGYDIFDGPSALPAYAQVSVSNQLNYVWAPSTTELRALQTAAGSSSRMASCYYSSGSFSLDVNLTDGQTHQMALYMLDWDSTGRAQTVRVTDPTTGATLDSRSVSNFHNGQYLVWNVSGHVQITFLYGGGANAVASGLFFGSSATQAPTAPTSLTATAPAPTRVVLNWTASTGPVSSYHVERSSNGSPFTEIAANVSGTTYTDNTVQQNTSYTYQVRAQNSAGFSGYSNPQPVTTPVAAGSTLTFVNTDTTTQGTWTGVYGSDGYGILDGPSALPAYAQVSVSNQLNYVWAPSTTDVRALQTAAGSSSRMASCYYSSASFTLDVNLTDGLTHQMALYMLDWDSTSRAQTVRVTDASTGATLDSRSVSNFHNGQYLVWNVSGHVQITFLYGSGANAVASGLFFGPATTPAVAPMNASVRALPKFGSRLSPAPVVRPRAADWDTGSTFSLFSARPKMFPFAAPRTPGATDPACS